MRRVSIYIGTFLTVFVCMFLFCPKFFAEDYSEQIYDNKLYYIEHVESGKFLDVDSNNVLENGVQLQIWDKWQGHNNQVFAFIDTGNGWKIYSYASNKIIEVRNSSHDDYAEVAQWDNHDNRCGKWNIIYNSDGTVSFQNCESGLYMNVFNNGTENGSKLIQFHSDNTTAEKFIVHGIKKNDVLNAMWSRNISENEIMWTYMGNQFYITNNTNWKKNLYYPTPDNEYLMKIEYLDPKTVAEMIKARAYVEDSRKQIEKAIEDGATEQIVSIALEKLHISEIPFLSEGVSILKIILENENTQNWNEFLDTVQYDDAGRCSGIIVYEYVKIVEKYVGNVNKANGTIARENRYSIDAINKYKYQRWSGDDFLQVKYDTSGMNGKWQYNFK